MRFLENVYKDGTLRNKCRHILLLQWFEKWWGHFYSMDADTLQALDTSLQGIAVKKTTIFHSEAQLCLFASNAIGNGNVIEYLYDSLLYFSLTKERQTTKT